jgi:dolichol-phosphate mannosyltransferase
MDTHAPLLAATPRRRVWIVLPAYDEEAGLPKVLAAAREAMEEARLPYQVVVVDDGSSDRTTEVARAAAGRMPLTLIRHPVNLGLGATLRDGLLRACEEARPHDVIVTLDADDSQSPETIPRLVGRVREGWDVVVASRFREDSQVRGVPWTRRFLSWGASWLFRLLYPIPGIRDYTCGFRAYRAAVLQDAVAAHGTALFDQTGFQSMVDVLLRLGRRHDLVFGEVPFVLRYDRKHGASKMQVARTVRDSLLLLAKRRLGSR